MTLTGAIIRPYQIGPLLGKGSYGDIYAARNTEDGTFVAIKIESLTSERKVLETEAYIMRKISKFTFFPKYITFGKTQNNTFLVMELCGPSLSYVIKNLPEHKLSLSTGIRTMYIVMQGLEQLHHAGIIHRDVKPSNVLLRTSISNPIAIIDFGLSRVFIDKWTKKQLPPRQNPGFRGTTIFASPHAHLHQELSPRDDLISWYYMCIDLIVEPLPWRNIKNRADILEKKLSTNLMELGTEIAPQFQLIWRHITTLNYEDTPDYNYIYKLLEEVMRANNINMMDPFDWNHNILKVVPTENESLPRSSLSSEASVHEVEKIDPEPQTQYNQIDPTPLIAVKSSKADAVYTTACEAEDKCCCCLLV
ncbi:CK1 family protein kinase [Trichomonas vaginalis G3]|uniref:non-specific serine/threonine protein kinase n=1 Tax=Trichomonas vaginalis (strain ATCC PRA-98 / G3) TaxID=412133 RepID=A2FI87_TRIV3|nr:protein kinase protein [Trichomonas vaginalis G3]EAX95369.1 CK1 family protein kinase [Trichomonas vaginalis G3]KAI5510737.1 protein kinase protein [Trichomonas vaginalis G3]|eukprot:XP_001308299.1 CK1 family protein kinase [Trichomonas vaginalis G3]